MLVFVAWSGNQSKQLASALAEWLETIFPTEVETFVSMKIPAGKQWFAAIGSKLKETGFAILCLNRENQGSAWLNFEAGACAKHMDDAYVVPLLMEGKDADYTGPWTAFQMKHCDPEGSPRLRGKFSGSGALG